MGTEARTLSAASVGEAALDKFQRADRLGETRGLEDHAGLWLDREGSAVIDDLVLAADLVHVNQRQPVTGAGRGEEPAAQGVPAEARRRGVDRYDEVGRRVGEPLEGVDRVIAAVVVPAVLADQETDPQAGDAQYAGRVRAWLEVPALVENVVGRQELLGVAQADRAVGEHQQAILQRLARPVMGERRADHPVQAGRFAGERQEFGEPLLDAPKKVGFVEQVAGIVAGQRQLGKDRQMGAFSLGLAGGGLHQADVAGDVAHGRIDLGEGEAEGSIHVFYFQTVLKKLF